MRPQDDLFRAVNGDWLATARIAPDRSVAGVFVDLRDDAEDAVRRICEDARAAGDDAEGAEEDEDEREEVHRGQGTSNR